VSADEEIEDPEAGVWDRHSDAELAPELNLAPPVSSRRRFWRRFKAQKVVMVAFIFVIFILIVAIFAPWLTPSDPNAQDLGNTLQPPFAGNGLGTDQFGRDVLSRLIAATRVSIQAAVLSVGIGIVLGVPAGLVAGYFRGWIDVVITRFTDAVLAFPPLILALAVIAVLGPGLRNAMIAIGIVYAPRFLRLARAEVISIREETYIEAARSIGTPAYKLLGRHVLPNALPPLIVQASLAAGFAILAEASLSFLGLGVTKPQASWGSMLSEAAAVKNQEWTLMLAPGIAIILVTIAFNVLGDGLRDSIGRETRSGGDEPSEPSSSSDIEEVAYEEKAQMDGGRY
jgi:peptide/nickel transport system permease protein